VLLMGCGKNITARPPGPSASAAMVANHSRAVAVTNLSAALMSRRVAVGCRCRCSAMTLNSLPISVVGSELGAVDGVVVSSAVGHGSPPTGSFCLHSGNPARYSSPLTINTKTAAPPPVASVALATGSRDRELGV
jgi:hypothetical protein